MIKKIDETTASQYGELMFDFSSLECILKRIHFLCTIIDINNHLDITNEWLNYINHRNVGAHISTLGSINSHPNIKNLLLRIANFTVDDFDFIEEAKELRNMFAHSFADVSSYIAIERNGNPSDNQSNYLDHKKKIFLKLYKSKELLDRKNMHFLGILNYLEERVQRQFNNPRINYIMWDGEEIEKKIKKFRIIRI